LRWDPQNKSFVSVGKIGVGTIGNIQVNRFVNGFIEYYKGRFNDRLILYIHIGDNEYYSFYYANGVMFVSATNPEFYNPIASQKSSERRVKPSKGMMGYRYMIGSKRELNRAQLRYKELAFGIKSDTPVDSDEDKPNKEGKEDD